MSEDYFTFTDIKLLMFELRWIKNMSKASYISKAFFILTINLLFVVQTNFSQQKTIMRVETEDFNSHYTITKFYGNKEHLCRISLTPKAEETDQIIKVVPFNLVEKFIEIQTTNQQREGLMSMITFNAGCTSISGESNKNIVISKTHICSNKNGIREVSIEWNLSECKLH